MLRKSDMEVTTISKTFRVNLAEMDNTHITNKIFHALYLNTAACAFL